MKKNVNLDLLLAVGLAFAACAPILSMQEVEKALPVAEVWEGDRFVPERPDIDEPSVYRHLETFWALPGVRLNDKSTAFEILGLKADATSDEITGTFVAKKTNFDIKNSPAVVALPELIRIFIRNQFYDLIEWARGCALREAAESK